MFKCVSSYTSGVKSFSASWTLRLLNMLYNSSWKSGSCYMYSDQYYELVFPQSNVRFPYSFKQQLISISNLLMLDIPLSVSFIGWWVFALLFERWLSPFVSIYSTTLALLLCYKPQFTYLWMLLQARNYPCWIHGHRNQSLDTLRYLMSQPSRIVVGMLPATYRLV